MPRRIATAALTAAALVAVVGCGSREAPIAPADATYTVRGEIVATPAPGNRSVLVHHESIPEFVARDGRRVGMDGMTMPFTIADSLSLDGLEAGDPIELDFEVRWDSEPILRIVRLEKLPAGTELDFSPLPDEPETEAGDETGGTTEGPTEESEAPETNPEEG